MSLEDFYSYNLETKSEQSISDDFNMMVPFYLMSAYAYYVEDNPIFSDVYFDNLSRRIKEKWDEIDHFHKDLITMEDLNAGTYLGEYPPRVIGGLRSFRKCSS